jgi:hypothetical protein
MLDLFISPHLDDVIFSLGSFILKSINRIIICTVFTKKNNDILKTLEGDYYLYGDYTTRVREDFKTIYNFKKNIIILHLDIPEEMFRVTNDGISNIIHSKLNTIINTYSIDSIYFPLAIGYHTDHKLIYETSLLLRNQNNIKYYFDYPYCTMKFNETIRLSDFGIFRKICVNDIVEYYTNPINRSCPWVFRLVKIIYFLFIYLLNYIYYIFNTSIKYELDTYETPITQKFGAMKGYKSQIKPIFGSEDNLYKTISKCPYERIIHFKYSDYYTES